MHPLQPVFVGDVQGCADELDELLAHARASFGDAFSLHCVGDLVNRGPDNLRALSRVRDLVEAGRGVLVLGNHELHLLRVAAGLATLSPLDSIRDVLEHADAAGWIDWLRRQPLAASGRIGNEAFAMLHAAAAPAWSLAELEECTARASARLADPDAEAWRAFLAGDPATDPDLDTLYRVTSCRSVSARGTWSPQPPERVAGGRAWHAAWAQHAHAYGIVYGHWSLQGLHVAPGLRGLDTGCVHHGRGRDGFLTAWVPNPSQERPFSLPDDSFWQVPARAAYYARRDSASGRALAADSD